MGRARKNSDQNNGHDKDLQRNAGERRVARATPSTKKAKGGKLSPIEERARLDTAHRCLRRGLSRQQSRELFEREHGIVKEDTVYGWKRRAAAEMAAEMADRAQHEAAVSVAVLDETIQEAFKQGELRTVVSAVAEKNKLLIFRLEREQPSADAKLGAAAAVASAKEYAHALAGLTADLSEDEARQRGLIDLAMRETVEKRKALIVNPPDAVADDD